MNNSQDDSMGRKRTIDPRHASATPPPPAPDPLTINSLPTDPAGRRPMLGMIDRYELVEELGGGGFGVVYKARDTVAGVEVAVKGLPPLVQASREELERVRENFALVSRLHHPHIAAPLVLHQVQKVWYASEDVKKKLRVLEDDYLFVMSYAPGVTLSKWRRQFPDGKVPVDQALEVCRQIADALDYAHSQKIMHRDIKPSNVVIETRGAGGEGAVVARVLDFGLAAEIRSSMSRISNETGDTSGTRPYMAPEQWAGRKQGPATDQYALAALFYEMVSGEVPFAPAFETGDPAIMSNVVTRESPEPLPELSRTRNAALARGLAKEAAGRFGSCGEFVEGVRGASVRGRGSSVGGRGSGASKRAWLAWAAGLLVLVSVGIGLRLAAGWLNEDREDRHAESEVLAEQTAEERGLRAEVERYLSVRNLPEAGLKLAQLEDLVGQAAVADLRTRLEGYATARDARQRASEAERAMETSKAAVDRDGEGLGEEWHRLDVAWRAGERALAAEAWGEALQHYNQVLHLSQQIEQIQEQRTGARAARARTADAEIVARQAEAPRQASRHWDHAERTAGEADSLYVEGDFGAATARWDVAGQAYEEATTWARSVSNYDQAKTAYENALAAADRVLLAEYAARQWREAQAKAARGAGGASDPDAGAADYREALSLLTQAIATMEEASRPKLRIAVQAGQRSVPATIRSGTNEWTAPRTFNLEPAQEYSFSVSYADPSGKRWEQTDVQRTANWNGTETETVRLEEWRGPTIEQNWRSPATDMEFVWIPQMEMWVGKFEVTNEEYRKKEPRHNSGEFGGHSLNGNRQPVVQVNFNEAKAYADWLTDQDREVLGGMRYRLPSNDEWQRFAQVGDGREYPWGKQWPPPSVMGLNYHGQEGAGNWSKIAGYRDDFPVTAPVDRLWRNPWGLYGVGGNVWEACASDSTGGSFGAWRGASWGNDGQVSLRCSYRSDVDGSYRNFNNGFRLVLSR
jgi:formylglycine-generating enzyme required for sulfatase activity